MDTVEKFCQALVRRKVQSAEAVKEIYRRWRKDPKHSDDVRDFVKWMLSKEYLSREQLAQVNQSKPEARGPKQLKPDAQAKEPSSLARQASMPVGKVLAPTRQATAIPLKEEEPPPRPTPQRNTNSAPMEIDVIPVSLEELALPHAGSGRRDLAMFFIGLIVGALVAGGVCVAIGLVG